MAVHTNLAARTAASALALSFAATAASVALAPSDPSPGRPPSANATSAVPPAVFKPSARTGAPPNKFKWRCPPGLLLFLLFQPQKARRPRAGPARSREASHPPEKASSFV